MARTKSTESKYAPKKSDELINQILKDIEENSSMSTKAACEKNNISQTAWNEWLDTDKQLVERYARAKERQAELLAQEIVEIADTCVQGERLKEKNNGEFERITGDMVERSKLRVDARKWVASKLLPKKYGDKLGVEHSGGMELTVNVIDRFDGK